ncbi:outer membrane family protein [Helicobacter pylori]
MWFSTFGRALANEQYIRDFYAPESKRLKTPGLMCYTICI